MDYSKIKQAMKTCGYVVTLGTDWASADSSAFRTFAHFTMGISHDRAHHLLQYPAHFEAEWNKLAGLLFDTEEDQKLDAALAHQYDSNVAIPITEPVKIKESFADTTETMQENNAYSAAPVNSQPPTVDNVFDVTPT